ncbi:hypothetical protein BH18ACI2_BH18ACI2_09130 [soil metagenome]
MFPLNGRPEIIQHYTHSLHALRPAMPDLVILRRILQFFTEYVLISWGFAGLPVALILLFQTT